VRVIAVGVSQISALCVSAGGSKDAAALADARLTAAFPSGHTASGHHVCCVMHDDDCEVGHVWFGPDEWSTEAGWWLWELEIDDAHRGRGIGTRVIALVEAEVSRLGGTTVGLSVFDHNPAARRLYDRLGYRAVSTSMRKIL
jgi:ribosomal protein S18 acetylase RimI-like enzyme